MMYATGVPYLQCLVVKTSFQVLFNSIWKILLYHPVSGASTQRGTCVIPLLQVVPTAL
jgi:hypothetical protein